MAPETATPQRVIEEERLRAEEDQARLHRISIFLKERRRRRRSRLVAVTTATAGMLLLAAGASWHLRDRGNGATPAPPASSAVVTQPIASPVPIEKPRVEIERVPAALPTAPPVTYDEKSPSVSHEQKPAVKPAAKPSGSARPSSKAAQAPVPPPKFLDRPQAPRETPIMRPIEQPAPATASPPARPEGRSPTRKVAPPPNDSPVDTRRNSGVESP